MPSKPIPDAYRTATPYLIVNGAADAIMFARVIAAGAKEAMAVADQFDGDRRGTLIDPFGHVWLLATRKEDISKEELQQRFETMMKQGAFDA